MNIARRSWGIVALGLLLTIVSTAPAKYSGGTGEPNNPYQIATAVDLIALGETPADYDKHFILTADIDLDPNLHGRKVFDRAVIARGEYDCFLMYCGFSGNPFSGVFDGKGHTVSHLTVKTEGCAGLFGGSEGEIKNLGVIDAAIAGSGSPVGLLIGYNTGSVTRCYSTGAITSGSSAGGLLGRNEGPVTLCRSAGAVTGSESVGGLVGTNGGSITECYGTGTVSGTLSVGGLVGLNFGTVNRSYGTGMVNGKGCVGGLVGQNEYADEVFFGKISNCYSTGTVIGQDYVGGVAGLSNGEMTQSYSAGTVSGESNVGGLVGSNPGEVANCFWDTQTSGQATSAGGTGKTTAEMKDPRTFQAAGWDFAGEIHNGTHELWQMPPEGGYPVLAILSGYIPPQLKGLGTAEDPYLISNALDLGAILHYSPNAHYRLEASIDLSHVRWSVPVIPSFAGMFDGNNLTIMHLTIMGKDRVGLFGELASGAEVKDLGIVDVNVAGSGWGVGGLVGANGGWSREGGSATHCHSTGTVNGDRSVGGLIGLNNNGGVTHCYSTATVSGRECVGGLMGETYQGAVTRCYSTGAVSGENNIGGLVGANDYGNVTNCYGTGEVIGSSYGAGGLIASNSGTVTHCYSTGAVSGTKSFGGLVGGNDSTFGGVTACFWDTQTSGQMTSAGGTGKTTAEMQDIQTYLDAGWDFVGEMANGTHEVWQMREGGGCPVLTAFRGYRPPALDGRGTSGDPYLIHDVWELGAVAYCPSYACYRLAASIDLAGIHWSTAVIPSLAGTFDGNNLTISYLTITGGAYLGLFGRLASGAEVKNLGVVHVNVAGSWGVGGLAGANNGTVTASYSTGPVSGGYDVGDLIGENSGTVTRSYSTGAVSGTSGCGGLIGYNTGTLSDCHSTGVVSGAGLVGGLVGCNGYSVTQCYSTGTVNGNSFVGGLVGDNVGSVTYSYSSGAVRGGDYVGGLVGTRTTDSGEVAECFWDTQTSGQAMSGGGTGKTTAEMQTAEMFLDAGWDFVGETANGTNDIWWINEGKDYPRLWWELGEAEENTEN